MMLSLEMWLLIPDCYRFLLGKFQDEIQVPTLPILPILPILPSLPSLMATGKHSHCSDTLQNLFIRHRQKIKWDSCYYIMGDTPII
jgi:hypothetical protein